MKEAKANARRRGLSSAQAIALLKNLEQKHYQGRVSSVNDAEDLAGMAKDFTETWADIQKATRSALSKRPPREPRPPATRRGIYRGPLEHRLEVLAFVADRALPFASLIAGGFDTRGKNISWRRQAAAWSRLHPTRPVTAEQLKHWYFDARADTYTQRVYRYRLWQDWRAAVEQALLATKSAPREKDFLPLSSLEARGKRLPAGISLPKEIEELLPRGANRRGHRRRTWGIGPWGRGRYDRASRVDLLAQRLRLWLFLSAALKRKVPRHDLWQWGTEYLVGPLRPM
jgi:hypothetical protein